MAKITVDSKGRRSTCRCRYSITRFLCRYFPKRSCQVNRTWDNVSAGGKSPFANPYVKAKKANKFWD